MPWVLVSGLAASVASFLITAFTSKPAITVQAGNDKSEAQQAIFKYGFYTLLGLAALQLIKRFKK